MCGTKKKLLQDIVHQFQYENTKLFEVIFLITFAQLGINYSLSVLSGFE
jgi:hypothetical protein